MELSDQWAYLRKYSPTTEENAIARTEMLREIGCKMTPEAYPYVVHGLIEGLDIRYLGHPDQAARMADAFLNEGKCPGARRLSEKDKARLRKIRDLAPPSPTAPAAEAGR
jgi:hypothetical protein